jgi:hypothetical protein
MNELDSPIETPDLALDTPGDALDSTPDAAETPSEAAEDSTQQDGQEAPPAASGSTFDQAKPFLLELRKTNPTLANQLKNAIFGSEALKKAFPEGHKEAIALKQTFEELGGKEGIQQLKTDLQQWDQLDGQFSNGDPAFVEAIAAENPEAFVKLINTGLAKFSEISPEGYSQYFGSVLVSDMNAFKIPLIMERLGDLITDPKAKELYGQIASYFKRFDSLSQQNVPPVGKRKESDTREQQLAQREAELERKTYVEAAYGPQRSIFSSEWKKLGGDKLSADNQQAAKELFASRFNAAISKIPKFKETCDRYFAAKDQAGYVRYMDGVYRQVIPVALRQAVQYFGKAPAKTAAAKPAAKPNTGSIAVDGRPSRDKIDYSKTTSDMILRGEAILTDGKKVKWQR